MSIISKETNIHSYAEISSEKLFHTREIPQSGSKAEDGEKERKKTKLKSL